MKMVRFLSKPVGLLVSLLSICSLSGCYYTAQSYNNGKLLDPGNSMFTLGIGRTFQSVEISQYDYSGGSSTGFSSKEIKYRKESILFKNLALNYQLGITDVHPFGGGIEIGILAEGQFAKDYGAENIPAMDFNVRLGFKDKVLARSLFQHNFELGWTTGFWLDNGFFLGYAGGWEYEKIIPYCGIRAIIMPTNLMTHSEWVGDDDFFIKHDQQFNLRLATGVTLKLRKIKVLPDYITPEFTLTGPNGSEFEPINGNLHVGFRWTNGL